MSAESILKSLETGIMKTQAAGMSSVERHALMVYLVTPMPKAAAEPPASAFCGVDAHPAQGPQWNGWGNNPANTRFQDTAAAGITAKEVPKLKLKWAFGLGDAISARAQPSIAGGRSSNRRVRSMM